MRLTRNEYVARYGPTTGDRIRLADTCLWVRVEADHAAPGDETMWGYGKNLRSRMSQYDAATTDSELDMVVLGVVVIDPLLGVVKADIGIKDGRIAGVGRAGSPDITEGVDLHIGPNTWPVNGHGLIATAGAIDSHVHLITPRLVPVALAAGVTTLITAGFEEPPYVMRATLEAFENQPVNLGLQASARTERPDPVERALEAGACGLKIHEDWGAYPEIIDATLRLADQHDVAVCLHTDGLNESCELEETVAAIDGRAVHAYHVEGAGGGHVPDLIGIVREPNVVCSSTTPTIPYGPGAAAEHLAMILAVHGGSASNPSDVAAASERIHPATMAAEGPLHDLGAISIVNSDSQGMGRIGETIRRTWQLAHAMKAWRASPQGQGWPEAPVIEPIASAQPRRPHEPGDDDNERVLRYLAKYTAEPARVHGIEQEVGSLAPAGWPTSSCGGPPCSVFTRNCCSRLDASPGEPWGRGTPPSRPASPAGTGRTGGRWAGPRQNCRSHSRPRRPSRPGFGNPSAAAAASPPFGDAGQVRKNQLVANRACPPHRCRSRRRHRPARRADHGRPGGGRGPAQPQVSPRMSAWQAP